MLPIAPGLVYLPHTMTRIRGKDIDGKVVTLETSQPAQLSLFQTFVPNGEKYSNTIELYDAVPKYFASTQQMESLREGGKYLPILERPFRHRGEEYLVRLSPARLKTKSGKEREFYPSQREELVEEALKKIACDRLNGLYLDNFAGVQFTLYELQQELKRRGHAIHLSKLIESLTICNQVNITIERAGGEAVMKSPIFPTLLLTNRRQWLTNPKQARCYVQFNPLVTNSIDRFSYRQFDYQTFMEHERQLSRWLHKRLSHNYTQADYTNRYTISMSTIIRDSGLVNASRTHDNIRHIDSALEELLQRRIITDFKKETVRGAHNRIEDVKYQIVPHYEFVSEMRRANQRKIVVLQNYESLQKSRHRENI